MAAHGGIDCRTDDPARFGGGSVRNRALDRRRRGAVTETCGRNLRSSSCFHSGTQGSFPAHFARRTCRCAGKFYNS